MNIKFAVMVLLIFSFVVGCQSPVSETPTTTPTVVPSKTPTMIRKVDQALISEEKLNCSPLGVFAYCVDPLLNIEFEYPTVWGEIEAYLKHGFTSGYSYSYRFSNARPEAAYYLAAGGRSKDYAEPRSGYSLDFAGYGDSGLQHKKEACESRWNEIYPICTKVTENVSWMIGFPKAYYFCNRGTVDLIPIYRIEINLPNNPTINGFVFETVFLSEQFSNQIESDLYSILGVDKNLNPTKCDLANQQAFDAQLKVFVENITTRSVDDETLEKLDELTHLALSITFR